MFYDIKKSGEHIRQLRKQSGYTQEALSKKLGIDRSLLSHIETGTRGCTVDMFIQLSEVFDVSLDLLVFGKAWNNKGGDQLKNDITQLITHLKSFEEKTVRCDYLSRECDVSTLKNTEFILYNKSTASMAVLLDNFTSAVRGTT